MKYKGFYRITCMLLSAALVFAGFAGCRKKGRTGAGDPGSTESMGNTQGEDGGRAMGRYMEEDLPLPAEFSSIHDMKKLEDGSIRMAGCSEGKESVWESKDDGISWEKVWDFPEELQDNIRYTALSSGGRAVCAYDEELDTGEGTETRIKEIFYLMESDGSFRQISFELPQVEELYSNLAAELLFVGNERILIGDDQGIFYLVNAVDGSVVRTYEFGNTGTRCLAFAAGKMLIFQGDSEVLLYDSETGEQKNPGDAMRSGIAESGMMYEVDTLDGGESIYYLSEKGMYHYRFGGGVVEQLIDGGFNSLGSFSVDVNSLLMLDERSLLTAETYTDENAALRAGLLKFTYSADTPSKPDKELKVYSLYEDNSIWQAVTRFQKEHADIYVHFETALSGENGMTVSDALKTLTTEIMAGKGPDVLVLDEMPVETYAEKGVLRDLSSVIEENGEAYFEGVRNAYRNQEGELYAVPTRFLIPMAQGGSAYYVPGEDFSEFTKRTGALDHMKPEEVISRFWYGSSAAWKREDRTLEESRVREFFEGLKQAYGEAPAEAEENGTSALPGSGFIPGEFKLLAGTWNISAGLFGVDPDYQLLLAVTDQLEGGDFGCMPGQAEHVFVPSVTVGISSKSSQPEAAEEFIKYLFTGEMQRILQGSGLPVQKEAFRSAIDGHEYEGNISQVEMEEGFTLELTPRTEEEIQKLMGLAESLTTPALQDAVIREAVLEQGEKMLKGEITPEEAASIVIRKLNLYLAE